MYWEGGFVIHTNHTVEWPTTLILRWTQSTKSGDNSKREQDDSFKFTGGTIIEVSGKTEKKEHKKI